MKKYERGIVFSQRATAEFTMYLGVNYEWVNQWTWRERETKKERGIKSIIKQYVRNQKLQNAKVPERSGSKSNDLL